MMDKAKQSAGLRGVTTGATAISTVGKQGVGLSYRGYDIAELAERASFDEVAYLLTRGELPTALQLSAYRAALQQARVLPKILKQVLATMPAQAQPMDVMRTACSVLGVLEPEKDFSCQLDIADRLLAVLPAALCYWYRLQTLGDEIDTQSAETTLAGQLLALLYGRSPTPLQRRAMDVSLILYAEHEFNASTFTARVCASTLSDFYSAVCGAIGALRGPLHGGANEAALALIGAYQTPQQARIAVNEKLQRKEKIMGFGHAVYRDCDPRSAIIKQWAKRLAEQSGDQRFFLIAEAIEQVVQAQKGLFANLDFYSAVAYYYLGIPASLATPIFVCSRVAGWSAHIVEQRSDNVLIRPAADYIGAPPRRFINIAQRANHAA